MADLPRGCTILEVDDSKYSSFVPVIGMHIAGISLVCLLAISYDAFSVFRHKKRWLPCQIFTLNSLTLTLLGIAAKLPVDLTTPMPTPLDQFSKLTGTSFICIAMGFLMPSLGSTSKSETLSNMLALSIFVVTVVVNICIQIRTGVIFLLITEHVTVMCFMLAMLIELWFCSVVVASKKDVFLDHNKFQFRESDLSLKERLEFAYVYGFNHNPQFLLCTDCQIYVVAGLCIACLAVVLQASIRTLNLEFCEGSSDYGWSVWLIVLVQILIVTIGSFAVSFRCLGLPTSVTKIDRKSLPGSAHPSAYAKFMLADARFEIARQINSSFLRMNSKDWCSILLKALGCWMALLLYVLVCVPLRKVFKYLARVFGFVLKWKREEDIRLGKYVDLLKPDSDAGKLHEWGLIQSVKDLYWWEKISKSRSVKNLSELLKGASLSEEVDDWKIEDIEVSSLSIVVLVRIAQTLPSSEFSKTLLRAYGEVYEIVHFVEDRIKLMDIDSRKKSKLAEALRMGMGLDLRGVVTHASRDSTAGEYGSKHLHFELSKDLYDEIHESLIWQDAQIIKEYIRESSTESTRYECIQKLFVDMLLRFLTRLPHALYKVVTESAAEDFYESVKASLGMLWKIEPLHDQIQWSFPPGFPIVCGLIKSSVSQRQIDQEEDRKDVPAVIHPEIV